MRATTGTRIPPDGFVLNDMGTRAVGPRLAPLGVTEDARAGAWRRELARRGTQGEASDEPPSPTDCLIAAAALGVGAELATANVGDFPMPELTSQRWD